MPISLLADSAVLHDNKASVCLISVCSHVTLL
jgi:hypothetical protein